MELVHRTLDRYPVLSLAAYLDLGGGQGLAAARQASPAEVIALVHESGLRGRGGAGFPTGTKWATVAASASSVAATTVVVNAAEGEPGTFKDRALLRTNPYRVLEGAIIAAVAMQTGQICIGIKASFASEIERLIAAIAEVREAGWLDGIDVQLVLGPNSYLFGDETALLEVISGRQPFPRVTPPYRRGMDDDDTRSAAGVALAEVGGSDEPPALVDNVETLANVALILANGPAWFRELGTDASPGTIVCTVSGATRRSGVGEVAMGTTLRDVIDSIGWGATPGHRVSVVLGGTANAMIPAALLDTPLTYEAMQAAGSGLGSAGFILFDDKTDPAAVAAGVARFLSVESCGQCEPCKTDGLAIAVHLRDALHTTPTTRELAELRRNIDTVAIGARCNLARQQAAVADSLLVLFPDRLTGERPSTPSEPVYVAAISDLIGGRAVLDPHQLTKQPDWSYDDTSSEAAPAARLGNTPVHITSPTGHRHWPEWDPSPQGSHPLEIVDDAHRAIGQLIDRAITAEGDDKESAVDDATAAIRTHIDVTRRILYPTVRRASGEAGDLLADAAEAQERDLLHSIEAVRSSEERTERLRDLGVAMQTHAELDDRILEQLGADLEPPERSKLADGLAAATATSTVNRL